MTTLIQFLVAMCGTVGFCILCHVPKRRIPIASIVGGVGWLLYYMFMGEGGSNLTAGFIGACAVGALADILARVTKDAATVYIIPGIIPLVPGAGMYRTTLFFINGDLENASAQGSQTLLMAGSISLGLMAANAIMRLPYFFKKTSYKQEEKEIRSSFDMLEEEYEDKEI